MNKKIILAAAISCFCGVTVGYSASMLTVPHTFSAGTPIKASEMNANFAALAAEITALKTAVPLPFPKASNYSELVVTPINKNVGETVTVDGKTFTIQQSTNIADPISGSTYTIRYPKDATLTRELFISLAECTAYAPGYGWGDGYLIARKAQIGSRVGYVTINGELAPVPSGISKFSTSINFQVSGNICLSVPLEFSSEVVSRDTATIIINRATELLKYISVEST